MLDEQFASLKDLSVPINGSKSFALNINYY